MPDTKKRPEQMSYKERAEVAEAALRDADGWLAQGSGSPETHYALGIICRIGAYRITKRKVEARHADFAVPEREQLTISYLA